MGAGLQGLDQSVRGGLQSSEHCLIGWINKVLYRVHCRRE